MLNRKTYALSSTRLLFVIPVTLTLSACGSDPTPFTLTYSVAAGDLNGDGRTDLASGNTFVTESQHPGHVSVILQSHSTPGSFGSAMNLDAGSDTVMVSIGDLNGDNLMDVVAANATSASISILIQNASSPGSFLAAQNLGVGEHPSGVAIGDLNGDGHQDIAVADSGQSIGGSLLFQNASVPGTFLPRISLRVQCSSFAIGDLNADGRADLVATGEGIVSILLQSPAGDGTFLPPQTVAAGFQPKNVAIADLNADGFLDLAVANLGAPDNPATASLSVLLNDSTAPGSFLAATNYATDWESWSVAAGDLNGDGRADLVVANGSTLLHSGPPPKFHDGSVSLLFQHPGTPGRFLAAVNLPDSNGPLDVAIADLNGDGLADIAQADQALADRADIGVRIRFQIPGQPGQFRAPILVGN